MVVGNRVDREGVGFGSDDNEVVLALRGGETIEIPRASKKEIAGRIFDELLKLRAALHATR
jgi:phosphopantothenoylcysteine decarboxylase/phosphopantothenate--cysteine ligase